MKILFWQWCLLYCANKIRIHILGEIAPQCLMLPTEQERKNENYDQFQKVWGMLDVRQNWAKMAFCNS